jgi:hypothetical protein
MGILFSQQNNNPKKDKIHIEPIIENENNLQPVIHSELQPVYQSISQPILPPLELQFEPQDEIRPAITPPVMNENLKKEIHSKHLLRVINEDKHNDQENICEDENKNINYKNKKKRKRKKKEEKEENN